MGCWPLRTVKFERTENGIVKGTQFLVTAHPPWGKMVVFSGSPSRQCWHVPGCPPGRWDQPLALIILNSVSSLSGEDAHSSPVGSGHLPPWGPHCSCTWEYHLCADDSLNQIPKSDLSPQLPTQTSDRHAWFRGRPSSPWDIAWPNAHSLPLPHLHLSGTATIFPVAQGTKSWLWHLSHPTANQSLSPATAPCTAWLSTVVGLYLCICISLFEEITHSFGL